LNEDRHILSVPKGKSMILVSRNTRYLWILIGVPRAGSVKRQWGCQKRQF